MPSQNGNKENGYLLVVDQKNGIRVAYVAIVNREMAESVVNQNWVHHCTF